MQLTEDQTSCLDEIRKFLQSTQHTFIVSGIAGTGKSFLMYELTRNIRGDFCAMAPTHKAKRVLSCFLNSNRAIPIPVLTVASFLGRVRRHGYVKSNIFSGTDIKYRYSILILDEVSMVSDRDLSIIVEFVKQRDAKLICIGDPCQIPSPSQGLIKVDGCMERGDSAAFKFNGFALTNIVRQAKDSIIIALGDALRNRLYDVVDIDELIEFAAADEAKEELLVEQTHAMEEYMNDLLSEPYSTRILTYTNARVKDFNQHVRKLLGRRDQVIVDGELITGYKNVGYPSMIICNGCDYIAENVRWTESKTMLDYNNLVGHVTHLRELDSNIVQHNIFFIDPEHHNNQSFIELLIKLGHKVNLPRSTAADFRKYTALRNKVVFFNDIYQMKEIFTEEQFRVAHPLLFNKTEEIQSSKILAGQIEQLYPGLIKRRLEEDKQKQITSDEMLAHMFCVITKDVDYGYSLSCHKSQGSTYSNVYVNEQDFSKIADRYNQRLRMMERRIKERNQLRYVAYTRAAKKLRIIV